MFVKFYLIDVYCIQCIVLWHNIGFDVVLYHKSIESLNLLFITLVELLKGLNYLITGVISL